MTQYAWTGLGLANATTVDNTNVNTAGNGDAVTAVFTGTPTVFATEQDANGNGLSITAATTTAGRLDSVGGGSTDTLIAVHALYIPSGSPDADSALFVARGSSFAGYLNHRYVASTDGMFSVTNASNSSVTSALGYSDTDGRSPTMVAGHVYQIDFAVIVDASPTSTNGRIIARVLDLTDNTWNTTGEFFFDSGYTINAGTSFLTNFRMGKSSSTPTHPQFYLLNMQWRNDTSVNSTLDKTNAITNFVQQAGPTVDVTGTGDHYMIYATGTPINGGTISYSITQDSGTAQTPVSIASGVWRVDKDTAGLQYTVTVTETVGANTYDTPVTVVVPAAQAPSGQYQRLRRISGVWT